MASQNTHSAKNLVKDMLDKTILITGGSSGIGLVAASTLAQRGAKVVILCRDKTKGQEAINHVNEVAGNLEAEFIICDLVSLDSVRTAAEQFLQNHNRLDVLINNAGVVVHGRHITPEGYEETFEVNHLSHFLLTYLMLPLLKASAPSRIINTASIAHRWGHMHFDDIQLEKHFSDWQAYAQSKLANILFTRELAKRLRSFEITVNCLHPGMVSTNITRDQGIIVRKIFSIAGISAEKGAQTCIYLATSKEVEKVTGCYFVRNKVHTPSSEARNDAEGIQLWEFSEKLTGISFLPDWKEVEEPQKKAA